MGYKVIFRKTAISDLDKIDSKQRVRIIKKIEWFIKQPDPVFFAKQPQKNSPAQNEVF